MDKKQLFAAAQARQEARLDEYRQLAFEVANGNFPPAESIIEVCDHAGKSVEAFAAEVDSLERIAKLRADAGRGAAAQDTIIEIQSQVKAAEAELSRIVEDYRRRIGALIGQADEQRAVLALAKAAQRELRQLGKLPVPVVEVEVLPVAELVEV